MRVDLGKTRLLFTVREIVMFFTFLGALVAHVIRTEVQNEALTKEMVTVQVKLSECERRLALNKAP